MRKETRGKLFVTMQNGRKTLGVSKNVNRLTLGKYEYRNPNWSVLLSS